MGRAAQAGQRGPVVGGDGTSGTVAAGTVGDATIRDGVSRDGVSRDGVTGDGVTGDGGAGVAAAGPAAGGPAKVPAWLPPDRPLRADARRNRDAVLTAAAEAFASQGVEAPLEEIARKAGVGVGTLYRHFPNREALVLAVYSREVENLAASADTLAAQMDPADALREWMRRYVQYAATKRGLIGMLRTMMADNSEVFDRTKAQVATAAGTLLAAAAESGRIRSDVLVEDLTRSLHGVCMAAAPETSGGSECAGRLVDLVFDGLRYGAPAHR